MGQAEIPLNLPDVGSVVQNFVAAETEEPLISGNDFLLQNKCVIDIARQMVCVDGKEIKCSLERNLTSLFRLKVLETRVVPPNSEMVFPGYVHAQDNTILPRYSIIEPNDSVYTSGWTIRPTFNQSSVSWHNCVQSLTTSRNRLNLTLLCVSQYPHIFMSSLCGVGVRARVRVSVRVCVRVNNFSSKTTRPRDVLFLLKDTLSIEDEKIVQGMQICLFICLLETPKV